MYSLHNNIDKLNLNRMLVQSSFHKFCFNFLQSNDEHLTYILFYKTAGTTPLVLSHVGWAVHVCSLLFGEWKFGPYDPYFPNFPFHYCKVSLMAYNLLPAVPMPLQYYSSQCMWSVTACCFTVTKGSWMIPSFCWLLQMTLQEKSLPFGSMVLRRQIHFCYCSSLCGNYRHGIFHRRACICLWMFIATFLRPIFSLISQDD